MIWLLIVLYLFIPVEYFHMVLQKQETHENMFTKLKHKASAPQRCILTFTLDKTEKFLAF